MAATPAIVNFYSSYIEPGPIKIYSQNLPLVWFLVHEFVGQDGYGISISAQPQLCLSIEIGISYNFIRF